MKRPSRASKRRTHIGLNKAVRQPPHSAADLGERLERERRQAVALFRDELHDARAKTIRPEVEPEGLPAEPAPPATSQRSATVTGARILVEKTPPAPLMDGFDVRRFRAGHRYDVDDVMASYLVIAGYAIRVEKKAPPPSKPSN